MLRRNVQRSLMVMVYLALLLMLTVTPTPTTDTVVLDADAAEVKQTKVLFMLCKAHFLRKSGSRGLFGLPAFWRGCEGCKAFMCCDKVKCRNFYAMHSESCATK